MVPSVIPARQWTGCPCGCESRAAYQDPECVILRPIITKAPAGHWPCAPGPCVCSLIAAA